MLFTILLVILILLLIGALPPVGIATNYYPAGLVTILLIVLVVLMLTGRL
jgi:hypothetical protein